VPPGGHTKEATDVKPPMKRDVDRNTIQEVLTDLETRLEAYLVRWRRELGIQKWYEAGTDQKEHRSVAIEREEQRRYSGLR
jgi:hypothetical protein